MELSDKTVKDDLTVNSLNTQNSTSEGDSNKVISSCIKLFESETNVRCSKLNEKITRNVNVQEVVGNVLNSSNLTDEENTTVTVLSSENFPNNDGVIYCNDTTIAKHGSLRNTISNSNYIEKTVAFSLETNSFTVLHSTTAKTYSIKSDTCPDPLNVLTQNYENNEPVTYFSGIVNHLTTTENIQQENEENIHGDFGDEFSVTNLMNTETVSDIFDKVYEKECANMSETFSTDYIRNNNVTPAPYENVMEKYSDPTIINSVSVKSSLKRPTSDSNSEIDASPQKKSKRGISFNTVDVYYFPRTQGFTCIPSQGGSTLGMSWNHSHTRSFSLGEHAAEQRRSHKQICVQQLSRNWNDTSITSSDDSDSDEMISDSEIDYENFNFLQPIPTKERRALLRAAGIHKIDSGEKDECRTIRISRELCGCTCQVYCDPERCVCAQAGIKCQVDRMNFPCSCSRDGCANENGRVEFNPIRVRTHYVHTLMRLEMEKKKEQENDQRQKFMRNESGNLNQYPYFSSSEIHGSTLLEYNYNNLSAHYQQPLSNELASASGSTSFFNFNHEASNNQFDLTSNIDKFSQSVSMTTNTKLCMSDSRSTVQYSSSEIDLSLPHFNGDTITDDNLQHFVFHDWSNVTKNDDSQIAYNNETFAQFSDNNCEQQIDGTNQCETRGTSAELGEETEKEESDLENFGDIIKKTIVESVIA